jgi:hypothetical protein
MRTMPIVINARYSDGVSLREKAIQIPAACILPFRKRHPRVIFYLLGTPSGSNCQRLFHAEKQFLMQDGRKAVKGKPESEIDVYLLQ